MCVSGGSCIVAMKQVNHPISSGHVMTKNVVASPRKCQNPDKMMTVRKSSVKEVEGKKRNPSVFFGITFSCKTPWKYVKSVKAWGISEKIMMSSVVTATQFLTLYGFWSFAGGKRWGWLTQEEVENYLVFRASLSCFSPVSSSWSLANVWRILLDSPTRKCLYLTRQT